MGLVYQQSYLREACGGRASARCEAPAHTFNSITRGWAGGAQHR
ncbi:MAG: hypothetical protein NZ455_13120 [Bacteroidia bacterium]|nr:hypothetical protein [Bacteroidia bacterium]